jgi:cellulose synthase/poly-beta-1,6-N-acetylglucosamine synthase-like glycosyltransferase
MLLGIVLVIGFVVAGFYLAYLAIILQNSAKRPSSRNLQYQPNISFIIPCHNEEQTIQRKLENVLQQDYPLEKIEITIIDSSTDKTADIVTHFKETHPQVNMLFIKQKQRTGKSIAINKAYAKSSGEIHIISDSDSIMPSNAISNLTANFADAEIGAATGRGAFSTEADTEQVYLGWYNLLRQSESNIDSTPIFDGHLSAYRADLIENVPENINADDSAQAISIRRKGYRTIFDARSTFTEYGPAGLKELLRVKVRRGQGLIRIFWRNRDLLFNSRHGKFSRIIMPAEFFMLVISPILVGILLILAPIVAWNYLPSSLILIGAFVCVGIYFLPNKRNFINPIRFITSFLVYQLSLLYAMILWIIGRKMNVWKKSEKVET